MSIRIKTLLIAAITLASLFLLMAIASNVILLESFDELEQEKAEDNIQQALSVLETRKDVLQQHAASWSVWDDAYNFMADPAPDSAYYVALQAEALSLSDKNLFILADTHGEVVASFQHNIASGEILSIPQAANDLMQQPAIVSIAAHKEIGDANLMTRWRYRTMTGVVMLHGKPTLIGVTPILTSQVGGPSRGAILFGRFLDSTEIEQIRQTVHLDMDISPIASAKLPESVRDDLLNSEADTPIAVYHLDNNTLGSYTLVRDINEQPILVISVRTPRTIYQEGRETIVFFLGALLAFGFVLILGGGWLMERLVLSRVTRLSDDVNRVALRRDLSERVIVNGEDEISHLSNHINAMLESVELSQAELRAKEERLQAQNLELEHARLRAEESARLKSAFLASMSHELRTPLNAIIGYSQLMLRGAGGTLTEKHSNNLERIYANGQHLLTLINDVLDLAKIEAGRTELLNQPFDIRGWADELQRQTQGLADEKKLTYTFVTEDNMPQIIVADRERLKQVALNLLSNAIKFTKEGGVTLTISHPAPTTWQMVVKDTGIGIPAHAQEYIFDQFRQVDSTSTREYGGTGLGLAIVHNLLQLMGGTIRVNSQVGEGSTFIITLPMTVQESQS